MSILRDYVRDARVGERGGRACVDESLEIGPIARDEDGEVVLSVSHFEEA